MVKIRFGLKGETMNVKVELYRKSGGSQSPSVYLVKVDGVLKGRLEKFPNTRTDTHPWKAFAFQNGDPMHADKVGFFYAADGGKKAAVAALVNS